MNIRGAAQCAYRWAALALLLCACALRAGEPDPRREMNEARLAGWSAARTLAEAMRRPPPKGERRNPALAEWLAQFDQVAAQVEVKGGPPLWKALDAERLVSRNRRFWNALLAAPPGESVLPIAHGALLLADGETARARYVLVLAAQNPRLPAGAREALHGLVAVASAAGAGSRLLVREGVRERGRRDFPAALEKLTQALIHWPQNAAAYWEIGRTLREQAWEATRNLELPDAPEIGALFAHARRHDPLLLEAYHGERHVRPALMAMMSNRGPTWLRDARDPAQQAGTEALQRLAVALQRAGADELALAAWQALRARRGEDAAADQPFIAASLEALFTDAAAGRH